MSTITQVLKAVETLSDNQKALETRLDRLAEQQKNARAAANPFVPGHAPHARVGEDPLTSRGFSFLKAFGVISGKLATENAKVELDLSARLQKLYVDQLGYNKASTNSFMLPFAADLIAAVPGTEDFAREIREVVRAGVAGFDRQQVAELRQRYWGVQKALSWVDETLGGALVAPPIQGELIELLRNNEVFMQAGARMIAMPPNGRIVFPRQTSPGTAYWVGESTTITDSTPGTGDVVLQAKKLGVLMKIPNELFRFSSVSVEQFIREDMARVLALRLDKSLLDAVGSSIEPKGITNYANITNHTSVDPGTTTNGYKFQPEDVAQMIAKVESQNAIFKAFIMRPLLWATIVNRRADAVSAGDHAGPFVFNLIRELQTSFDLQRMQPGNLYGYPVYKSTQVSNTRSKGASTNLTQVIGGDFTDYVIAMSGAIEFQISTQGDTPFATDQTWFRGINYCDGAPRHEASFVLCDQLFENQ
jgi:HK97 family phage major capsid protein